MPDLTLRFVLLRQIYHALGAIAVGLAIRWLNLPVQGLYIACAVVFVYELTNEHPDWRWWLKSLLDFSVWSVVMSLVVLL